MWRRHRWIAILLASATLSISSAYASNTQSKRFSSNSDIRVVAVTPDTAGNFVLLNTLKSRQLGFPTIRYMPSGDGHSIMTVDFAGVVFQPQQAAMSFTNSAVKSVRVGQLQQFPPIMRISMVADRAEVFGGVDFRSAPGTLTIKLPAANGGGKKSYEIATMPPVAPERASTSVPAPAPATTPAAAKPAVATPSGSDAKYLPWTGDDEAPKPAPEPAQPGRFKRFLHKLFSHDNNETEPQQAPAVTAPPPVKQPVMPKPAPALSRKPPAQAKPVKPAAPSTITTAIASAPIRVSGAAGPDRFFINIASTAHFTYRTFRLANPDRLVVDITGIEQPSLQVAPIAENPYIKGVRVGNPDHNTNITRIVCDLATTQIGETTTVQEAQNSTALNIILQKDPNAASATATNGMPPVAPEIVVPKSLRPGMTVVLDAGHGGHDPGAQRGDIQEKALTLDITEKLRKALEAKNVKCYMTRSNDTFVSLEDRVRITNQLNPDAFVSIHINSLETNNSTTGIETYYQTDRSKDLAALIHASLVKGLSAPDRGVRKARFYVINHTPVPAILAEVGFISSKDERDKLISSDYQEQIASAVADGVILYLSGTTHSASSSAPSGFTQNLQTAKAQQLQSKQKRLAATRSL
jgi:N-acetylmuramoyl-L-alanine amidase